MVELSDIEGLYLQAQPVGSRVTCNPAPTDTDMDIIVLTNSETFMSIEAKLVETEWKIGGSLPIDAVRQELLQYESFTSYKRGEVNIILTSSSEFFRKFMLATTLAKRFNLLIKADRIALFQAVLYSNEVSI